MYDCIEEKFVWGVLSFSRASEESMYDLQGSEGVSCDVQVVVVLEVDEGYVYGREFCP